VPSGPTGAGAVLVTVFPHPALLCGFPSCCARLVYAFAQGLKFLPQSAGYSSVGAGVWLCSGVGAQEGEQHCVRLLMERVEHTASHPRRT
jgi:hypothetical protein